MENEIAVQLMDRRVDVLLGGGRRHFVPQASGRNRTDEIDRPETGQPSLAELTKAALRALSADRDGFLLMVEGGKIDHACHSTDPATAVRDTLAFDAVAVALQYARRHPDTLVVVTADHETGGMSLGAAGKYELKLDALRKVTRSAEFMAGKLNKDRSNAAQVVAQYGGIQHLSADELALVRENKYPSNAIGLAISSRALVGWTSSGHTGAVIPLMAHGACASQFCGFMDNTEVARLMADATRIDLASALSRH